MTTPIETIFNDDCRREKSRRSKPAAFRRAKAKKLTTRSGVRRDGARSGRGSVGGLHRLLTEVRKSALRRSFRRRFADFRGELFDDRVGDVAFRTVPNDRVGVGFLERGDFFRHLARGFEFNFRVNDQNAVGNRDGFDRVLDVDVGLVKNFGAFRDDRVLRALRFKTGVGEFFANGVDAVGVFLRTDFKFRLNAGDFFVGVLARLHQLLFFGFQTFDQRRHFVGDARVAFEDGTHIDDGDNKVAARLIGGARSGRRSGLASGGLLSFDQTANQAKRGAKKRAGKGANVFHFEFSLETAIIEGGAVNLKRRPARGRIFFC